MGKYTRPGRRRHRPGFIWFTASGAVLALVVAFAVRGGSGRDRISAPEVVVLAQPTIESTVEPTAELTATPVPQPTPKYRVVMPTPLAEGYLPIFEKAETNDKIIAVTVDDFFQFDNAQEIVDLAVDNGAKLTLFPLGKNVVRKELKDTLRHAYECGMEIENHTYDHRHLYKMSDTAMARQVYLQCLAVDDVLGVHYQQHFFRPPGGAGCEDQRTHAYIAQLGMYGIAYWTVSGSDTDAERLLDTLAPGNIYLFHTTDSDTEKLEAFIPAAVEAGYTLVTLNEMFGLPDNEVTESIASDKEREIPALEPYVTAPRTCLKGDCSWQAHLIQQRLNDLGYLYGEPDGVYGDATARAVGNFQQANALEVTGKADQATQDLLFSEEAIKK